MAHTQDRPFFDDRVRPQKQRPLSKLILTAGVGAGLAVLLVLGALQASGGSDPREDASSQAYPELVIVPLIDASLPARGQSAATSSQELNQVEPSSPSGPASATETRVAQGVVTTATSTPARSTATATPTRNPVSQPETGALASDAALLSTENEVESAASVAAEKPATVTSEATPTPTATATPIVSATATASSTATATPTRTASPAPTSTPRPPSSNVSQTGLEQDMLAAHNEERTSRGLAALSLDANAQKVARERAHDMVDNDYFAHVSPTGETAFTLLKQTSASYRYAGENIAYNSGYGVNRTVAVAMNGLMDSPGHRDNILSPKFNRVGIGVVEAGNGTYFYAIIFLGS